MRRVGGSEPGMKVEVNHTIDDNDVNITTVSTPVVSCEGNDRPSRHILRLEYGCSGRYVDWPSNVNDE